MLTASTLSRFWNDLKSTSNGDMRQEGQSLLTSTKRKPAVDDIDSD